MLLTDDNDKPLGFISLNDITNNVSLKKDKVLAETKTFKDIFSGRQVKDDITGTIWTEKGVSIML